MDNNILQYLQIFYIIWNICSLEKSIQQSHMLHIMYIANIIINIGIQIYLWGKFLH